MASLKPSQARKAIEVGVRTLQPTMIWGSPGIGKSDLMRAIAKELGRNLRDVRLTLLDSVDLRGFPFIREGRMAFATPEFLPTDPEADDILFLDEINAADPAVQAAAYQLVLDRQLGEYVLPANVSVIAAGNRETDQAVTHTMPSPLANRFLHIDMDVNLDDWKEWAISNAVKEEVISFISYKPNLLNDFDPDKKAFPTPRSWSFVSKVLGTCEDKTVERELVSGSVGEGAAGEFLTFLRVYQHLPDPDLVLERPMQAPVPEDLSVRFALCGALSHRAKQENFGNLIKYVGRLPTEYQVLSIRDAVVRDRSLVNHASFASWAVENSEVMV